MGRAFGVREGDYSRVRSAPFTGSAGRKREKQRENLHYFCACPYFSAGFDELLGMNTEFTDEQIDRLIGWCMLTLMEEEANQPPPTDEEIAFYMDTYSGLPLDKTLSPESEEQVNDEDHGHHSQNYLGNFCKRVRQTNKADQPKEKPEDESGHNKLYEDGKQA